MTLRQRLDNERADLMVSEWLQETWNQTPDDQLPREILLAYRADQFLMAVNMTGLEGYFENESESVGIDAEALRAIGLGDLATKLEGAADSHDMEALTDEVIGMSAKIEAATHQYISDRLSIFEAASA